jgi:hypothetical protein
MLKIFEANREREMTLAVQRHKRIIAARERMTARQRESFLKRF